MDLWGYYRVSTDDQKRHGLSLEQQPDRLRAYCDLHGHTLVGLVGDKGISASVPLVRRPGGRELLRNLREGSAQGVVVVSLDRLFRDALDGLEFFNRTAVRHKIAVHSIAELVDTSSPAGKLALTIQLAAAQYERDMAVMRATATNRELRRKGKVYGGVPYGCVQLDGKRLARDPLMWDRREYIVGLLRRGQSLRSVRDALSGQGIPSPSGRPRWSIERLRQLRVQHDDLLEIPFVNDLTDAPAGAPETEVSADA